MTMRGSAESLIFTSGCVDVVRLAPASDAPVESYLLTARDCTTRCYEYEDCPDWTMAMASLGPWAQVAEPALYVDHGDHEEYLIRRVMTGKIPSQRPSLCRHSVWEYETVESVTQRAKDWVQHGLDMGEKVVVVAPALCTELLQTATGQHPNLHFLPSELLLDMVVAAGGEFPVEEWAALPGTQMIREFRAQGLEVRLLVANLTHLLSEGYLHAAAQAEDWLDSLVVELELRCVCTVAMAALELEEQQRVLCRTHQTTVVMSA